MELSKIESFKVNHLNLLPGLYVSRKDSKNGCMVTTFDLRLTSPNREAPMTTGIMHTIEHLGATYLRSSADSEDIIYFGPMGCRTGFYLVMFGDKTPGDVLQLITDTFRFISVYSGDIPGAKPEECGNYSDQDLPGARIAAEKYIADLAEKRFKYGA